MPYCIFNEWLQNKCGGARVENYNQKITAENKPDTKHSNFDVLPSFVFTYTVGAKTNLRLAGSQAVNRPEFRELADYRCMIITTKLFY